MQSFGIFGLFLTVDDQVFNEADKDGDGNLTFTEFERVMYFYPEFCM